MAVTLVATTKRPRRHAHNGQRMRFVHGEISACSLFSPLSVSANPFSAYGILDGASAINKTFQMGRLLKTNIKFGCLFVFL